MTLLVLAALALALCGCASSDEGDKPADRGQPDLDNSSNKRSTPLPNSPLMTRQPAIL